MGNRGGAQSVFLRFALFACVALGSLMYGAGCRHDSTAVSPRVGSLRFIVPKLDMKLGERLAVKVEVKPDEARNYYTVEYAASVEGYVAISETSNDGCVLTAEKGGTVVVVAKAGGFTAYLEVTIDAQEIIQVPCILIPTQVIEVNEGSRKSVQVSLFNGNAIDQQKFNWSVEPGKDNITILPTGNVVVVQGEKRGAQKIIVGHDKSEYTAEILVFVLGAQETVKYITTQSNVITMIANGPNKMFDVTLVNGLPAENISGWSYEILEDNPCISILSSNNTCNVTAQRKGTAVIRVRHPLAAYEGVEYPLDVRVIACETEESWIELDWTFKQLEMGFGQSLTAALKGGFQESWYDSFHFTLKKVRPEEPDCIELIQTNYSAYIVPKAPGRCVINVSNDHIDYHREALVIVRDPAVIIPDEFYITTSQNVIQMEIGQTTAAQLNIQLINGNEADKAGFEWTVEDGRIIEVDALDLPEGKQVNYLGRAQAEIKSVANTLALVTPKKTGATKIIISHPKSPYSNATVICKVYPRGTFANLPYALSNPEGGLIKIDTTVQQATNTYKHVKLEVISGDPLSVGPLDWEIARTGDNKTIANIYDISKGLENEIQGVVGSSGVAKLTVNNDNLRSPYEATVMVGTTEQLKTMAVLYVDKVYQTVAAGQSVSVAILNSGMEPGPGGILQPNSLYDSRNYTVSNGDPGKVIATMIKSRLLLQGLAVTEAGWVDITIGNSDGIITPTTVKVMVVPDSVTVDKPYTLTGPNFVGLKPGERKDIEVNLTGAPDVESQKINWKSENAQIISVTGSGPQAKVSAGPDAAQTNITASHAKSVNNKVIVAYVDPLGRSPEEIMIIGAAQEHWLLKSGDEIMLQLMISKPEWAADLEWTRDSDNVIDLDGNGDKARVKAKAGGSAVITVRCKDKTTGQYKELIPLKIYVSVTDKDPLEKSITLPSIFELIIGENKIITAVTAGMNPAEIAKIKWEIDDPNVVSISGGGNGLTGDKLFVLGRGRGQAWITVRQDDFGYIKRILVVCMRTYEELAGTFVIAGEESYYRIKVGETRTVRLVFGSAGFPPGDIPFIRWSESGNHVVKIYDGGDYAQIEAVGLGITTVTVTHRDDAGNSIVLKPVTITVETYTESINGVNYVFNADALMIGLVTSKAAETAAVKNEKKLTVSIYPQGVSYGLITAYDENFPENTGSGGSQNPNAVFNFKQSGNEFIVTGRNPGQSYLRIKHPQVGEDLRVLIYAAATEAALDEMFPIALNKTNYLLTIGGGAQYIQITVPPESTPGFTDKIQRITWGPENETVFSGSIPVKDIQDPSKDAPKIPGSGRSIYDYTVRQVSGIAVGNGGYTVRYNGQPVEKAFISVKAKTALDFSKRIVTENIIGLKIGEKERLTGVGTNLTPAEIAGTVDNAGLVWNSSNPAIVAITPFPNDKSKCYLNAVSSGMTEVTVSYGQIVRYIKVYVANDVDNYKAVNLDNRYYQLRRNDDMILQAFHAARQCDSGDNWVFYPRNDPFDNRVVELFTTDSDGKTPLGKDKIRVRGINEGIATIILHNPDVNSGQYADVQFMVEVNNTAPLVETNPADWYMTAVKTVYALDETKTGDVARLSVIPVKFPETQIPLINWKVYSEEINGVTKILSGGDKPQIVDLYGSRSGSFCDLSVKGKKGTAVVRASHPQSINEVDFTVICDAKAALANPLPYIAADQEVARVKLYETATVNLTVENINKSYDINQFTAQADNDKVSLSLSGNRLRITGNKFGQSLITVRHTASDVAKHIVVMVMADDASLVYLTTRQNFVMLERNGYTALEVSMVGFEDINNANYHWETDDVNLISISPSGRQAVVSGKNVTGTAKVTVWNNLCSEYKLTIYIRITNQFAENPVYITTQNNILSIKEGASVQVKANLVNAGAQELSRLRWSTLDGAIIELNYSGDTASIKGLKPGTAGVTIDHDAAFNAVTVICIVEPREINNGIYIAADNILVEMDVRETNRLVRARLVGGSPEDVYGFRWEITNYVSVRKTSGGGSYPVITMSANADMCYVSPCKSGQDFYEGEATLTISHPKTNYRLDLKIIVRDNTSIQFSQAYITINQHAQARVNISGPSGDIIYESSNAQMGAVSGTNKVCVIDALKVGSFTVTAFNVGKTKSDQLLVTVIANETDQYYLDVQINGVHSSLLSLDAERRVTVRGFVRSMKTGEEIPGARGNISWKISNPAVNAANTNANIIILENLTNKGSVYEKNVEGQVQVYAPGRVAGTAEIAFKYDNPASPLGLAGVEKSIYVRVKMPDFQWILSHTMIRVMQGGAEEQITARVEGRANINYGTTSPLAQGDIQFSSSNSNVARVEYAGGTPAAGSVARVIPLRPLLENEAPCNAVITYDGSTQYIPVIVDPNVSITASPSTLIVQPGSAAYALVTCNPPSQTVSLTANSNIGVDLFGYKAQTAEEATLEYIKRDGSEGKPDVQYKFGGMPSAFTCGNFGYWVKVQGQEKTGSVTLTFEMAQDRKKTTVQVTNTKNEYVRWKEPYVKMEPTSGARSIAYTINPDTDYLECSDTRANLPFNVSMDKANKLVTLSPKNGQYYTKEPGNQPLVDPRGIEFRAKGSGEFIYLPYFIYYEGLQPRIYWERADSNSAARSSFDAVNYAITVAKGADVTIQMKVPSPYEIAKCSISFETPVLSLVNNSFNFVLTKSSDYAFTLSNTSAAGSPAGTTVESVTYAGTLTARYEMYDGGNEMTPFTRTFLIYAKNYK